MGKETKKYKLVAIQAAEQFIANRKAARKEGAEKAKIFKEEQANKKKAFKAALEKMDKQEKKAQKKGYKYFKKRKNRTARLTAWGAVVCVIALGVNSVAPILSMTMRTISSQQYTSEGEAADLAREAGYELSVAINEEGYVLLKNDDNVLPLANTKVNIFGDDAYNFVYGGSGSAGADQSGATSLFEAFEEKGISYNKDLDTTYHELGISTGGGHGSIKEMVVNYLVGSEESNDWILLEDEVINQAKAYADTAVVVLSAMEVEGSEIELALLQPMGDGMPNRAAMIDKICNTFENVIFIINSGNVMELDFLNEYESAKAALWVGAPGSLGCGVIADVLTGKVNPSGRSVNTYPVAIEDEPSYQTYGNYPYTNLDMYTMEYSEGIYVGYRYYETRFGEDEQVYAKNVVFPFGHGLSYTTFEQNIVNFVSNDETITVDVEVVNTGDMAGKDVVQLYFMAPFYAGSSIEKSAIELAGYAKTDVLQPGESQLLSITYNVQDMSSYAQNMNDGCYILEEGDYKIAIGRDVHDALLSTQYETYSVSSDIVYKEDDTTGTQITNLFEFAQGDTTYLSRTDWEGTFPQKKESYTATEALLTGKAEYEKGETEYANLYGVEPTYNAANGVVLADLKGLDYEDALWEKFLDQFTVKEMIRVAANGGWHTEAVERLGVKGSNLLDGPSGINSMFAPFEAVAYPMETTIGSTWNDEIAQKLGEIIGDEANVYGVNGWYAPGVNIHRTSIGGRNSEYFSEDPLLSGNMSASAIQGAQSKGLIAFMKHFVCNDVELNARSGIVLWVNEQAMREIYLKPFEISVKEGGAYGAMSSFSFLGSKWCGGSSELLQDLLREEWGFRGVVSTDACLGSWMDAGLAVKNGNDLMLEMGLLASEKTLKEAYKKDPIGIGYGLRNAMHNVCYALVNGTNMY